MFLVTFLIDESHLPSLMTALVSVVDWFTLGVYLGVEYHTLKGIKMQNENQIETCKMTMLLAWLKNSEEICIKQQLLSALWYITNLE